MSDDLQVAADLAECQGFLALAEALRRPSAAHWGVGAGPALPWVVGSLWGSLLPPLPIRRYGMFRAWPRDQQQRTTLDFIKKPWTRADRWAARKLARHNDRGIDRLLAQWRI